MRGVRMTIGTRLDIYTVHDPSWHYRDPITVALVDAGFIDGVAS